MDKIDQAIIESIISVVNPDTTDTDQLVMEYLDGYFGGELNESTSSDDIVEAFANLLETADAVAEFMDLNEVSARKRKAVMRARAREAGQFQAHDDDWVVGGGPERKPGPKWHGSRTSRSYGRQLARASGKRSPMKPDALRRVFKKAHGNETREIERDAAAWKKQQDRLKADSGEQAHNRMVRKGGAANTSYQRLRKQTNGTNDLRSYG